MRPCLASASRSGYESPSLIVSAVTPLADAVFAALVASALVVDDDPPLLLDELHAAATSTSATTIAALRSDRAGMDTPRCYGVVPTVRHSPDGIVVTVTQEPDFLNAGWSISMLTRLRSR